MEGILEKERVELLVKTINDEYKTRKEIRDVSILDETIEKSDRDVLELINNFYDKIDLARKFIEILPLHFDNAGLWWRWRNKIKRWEITDEINILNLINRCSYADIIKGNERTEIINALKQISRLNKPKKPKPTWIQFNNEIVDIMTGERFEASPEYFVTNPIPYNLGKKSETPTMDKIFEQWVGKDYIQTLYEIIAYCTLSDYPIHRLFCFIGEGMNGKSKFLELLRKFIGEHNCCSTELDVLTSNRFETTKLHKKLVCQMGETNFSELSKTSKIKKLTGGDLIGFEYKNKCPFDDINYAKIIIATNNLPATSDKTIGFYRRWLIIDFPNRFTEKYDILGTIPEVEYENLSMKCIEILYNLLIKREFHNEGDINERIVKFEDRSNPIEKFLKDNTDDDLDGYITAAELEKRLSNWCKDNRYRMISVQMSSEKLKKLGYKKGRKYADWLYDGKGGQMRVWFGLSWKD